MDSVDLAPVLRPFPYVFLFSSSNTADGFLGDYRLTLYDNPSHYEIANKYNSDLWASSALEGYVLA